MPSTDYEFQVVHEVEADVDLHQDDMDVPSCLICGVRKLRLRGYRGHHVEISVRDLFRFFVQKGYQGSAELSPDAVAILSATEED